MTAKTIVASAVVGGVLAVFAAPMPAQALPAVNVQIDKKIDGGVTKIKRGGGGFRGGGRGGFRGGRAGGFRGGRPGGGYRGGRAGGYRGGPRVRGYRGYGGRKAGPGKRYRGPRYGKRRYKSRRRYYGAPYVGYGYYYGGSCEYLRRKAYQTGSSYWWSRYRQCLAYY